METMIVIAIIAIVTSIAMPNMINWIRNQKFNEGVRKVYSSLQNSRSLALKENTKITIVFSQTSGSDGKYEITGNNVSESGVIPADANIENKTFYFNVMGFSTSAAGVLSDGSITIKGNGREAVVRIDKSGNVRIE